METNENLTEKLEYIGLDLNNIPDKLNFFQNINFRVRKNYIEENYKVYKYVNVNDLTSQVLKQTNEKDIFKLLEETLLKIEDGYDPIIITNILELKYLDYLGIKPVLDSCAVCGRPSAITVSTSKGGFVCANCHTNEKIVDKKTINVLRKLYHVDISKISKIKLSNNTRKEIDDFINEYYDRYSGLYLKSKNFLKSIKNVYI